METEICRRDNYSFMTSVLLRTFGKEARGGLKKANQHHFDFLIYWFSHASVLMALEAIALSGSH